MQKIRLERRIPRRDRAGITVEAVQRIAQGFPTDEGGGGGGPVPIGFDNRFLSDLFARRMAEVLAGNGIVCLLYESPVPTPWSCAPCATKAVRTGHDHGEPQPLPL